MSGKVRGFVVVVVLSTLLAIVAVSSQVSASGHVQVVKQFAGWPDLPEGVAVDKVGNIYASVGPPFFVGGGYGAIWKISPDGSSATLLVEYPTGPAPAGLAVDPPGTLYYALPNPGDPNAGVFRLAAGGSPQRLPGTEQIVLANGLALDKHGYLYITDSILGAVWRVPVDGSAPAEIWLYHPLLAGCPGNLGANGIAFWKANVYVANTSNGLLARVPILTDGSPGEPQIAAGSIDCAPDGLFGMDGIALDVHGNIYAMLVLQNKLVRINPADGSYTVLLTEADGLWNPASIAFGTGKGDKQSVFISNYAVIPPAPANSPGAAILKYDAGVPGLPMP